MEDEVILPHGEKTTYVYEKAGGGAATLILHEGKVLLSYQYRYPLDRWIYDMPGGGVGENETPEQAAKRECQEEVGMIPKQLVHLATFHPNPARTAWPMDIFFCNAVEAANVESMIEQESSEVVHQKLVPVKELEKLIQSGEIVDPSLLIAWYTARERKFL